MTEHTIGTREEWLAARLELLEAEKELTRRSDELAPRLPLHVRARLPGGVSSCSAIADGFHGVVYHTYSTYARGLDGLWSMYQWLDRAPLGRNETGFWRRRHDEYDRE